MPTRPTATPSTASDATEPSTAEVSPPPVARSLAEDLRRRDDTALLAMLRARPDLLHPVPADIAALAVRANTPPSVARALDRFDAFELGVAEVAATATSARGADAIVEAVKALLPEDADDVAIAEERAREVVADLLTLGLAWGHLGSLHVVRGVHELVSRDDDPAEHARELLAHVAPPEVQDALQRDLDHVDRSAAHAALDVVRLTTNLLEAWSAQPPAVLRAGGLGVRDLTRTAEQLDVDEEIAALIIETAFSSGLLSDDGAADPVWCPTAEFDDWLELDVPDQWVTLARGWLDSQRAAGLVGSRGAKDTRVAALSADLERPVASAVRRSVLAEFASLDAGNAPSEHDLVARLDWRHPRRISDLRNDVIRWTMHEASVLGVTGMGAISTHGRALLEPSSDVDPAAVALSGVLPEPVDHVILQPDLTAIAPGPLVPEVAREMALLADIESTGGATVYRFSDATVRRALDLGRAPADVLTFLTEHSRTPVPQPLEYMINDAARRHGALRVGAATAYIRCDDEATLSAVMSSRASRDLHLRQLAPTVLISAVAPTVLLDRLQGEGFAPAAESGDGVVVLRGGSARRASPSSRSGRVTTLDGPPDERLLSAAVRAMRSDRDPGAASVSEFGVTRTLPTRMTPAQMLTTLRTAIEDRTPLRIGYAGSDGSTELRLLDPISLKSGRLTGYDHSGGDVRAYAVSRITGVELLHDLGSTPDANEQENS